MKEESAAHRAKRMKQEYAQLVQYYPSVQSSLHWENAFQLVVATVLSAQTTDRRVNMVTPQLFGTYPTPYDLAEAPIAHVEEIIYELGFFHSKARHIIGLSQELCIRFDGVVPQTMEELITLPGVGRKTASLVLAEYFDKPGLPVDTHVTRLTCRLRWTDQWKQKNPDVRKIEDQIARVFPPEKWIGISHRLIYLGRDVCHPYNPECFRCPLRETCPSAPQFLEEAEIKHSKKAKDKTRKASTSQKDIRNTNAHSITSDSATNNKINKNKGIKRSGTNISSSISVQPSIGVQPSTGAQQFKKTRSPKRQSTNSSENRNE